MNIGEAIRLARKSQDIRQNVLAEIAGVTPAYLSLIESGEKNPTLDVLEALAFALETPLPILFLRTLEVSDIREEKQEAFKHIHPLLISIANEFFD